MNKIEQMAQDYIRDTGMARLLTRSDIPYFLFLDTYELIRLDDLGYNSAYGFYRLSKFPNVVNEAESQPPQSH